MGENFTLDSFYKSLFPVAHRKLEGVEEYLQAIDSIRMKVTGTVDYMLSNSFFAEACQMLANAVNLFQLGYFDAAFYSLRQTIETSLGTIYLMTDSKTLVREWNHQHDGFEIGKMSNLLRKKESFFKDALVKMEPYFQKLFDERRKIDKYVHKQGFVTFYTNGRDSAAWKRVDHDFEKALKACIGAVAVYRMVIDPLSVALMDDNLSQRAPDLMGESFSVDFIEKFIGEDTLNAYKVTENYKNAVSWLKNMPIQNEAVYALIHYQAFERKDYDEIQKQWELLDINDRIAVSMFMMSTKISQLYIDGILWYFSDVRSTCKERMAIGTKVLADRFKGIENDFNLPLDGAFLSRMVIKDKYTYVEHTEPLSDKEVDEFKTFSKEVHKQYIELQNGLNELAEQLEGTNGNEQTYQKPHNIAGRCNICQGCG